MAGDSGAGAPVTECLAAFPPYGNVWLEGGELFVGPAIGLVGELALARVTVRGCPSHPVAESFPIRLSADTNDKIFGPGLTICPPCFIFIFDYDLTQPRRVPVLVIVYDRLSDVKRSLADEVFQFLPSAMRGYLSALSSAYIAGQKFCSMLTPCK